MNKQKMEKLYNINRALSCVCLFLSIAILIETLFLGYTIKDNNYKADVIEVQEDTIKSLNETIDDLKEC